MKKGKRLLSLLACVCLAASLGAFAACDDGEPDPKPGPGGETSEVLNFVAVDGTNWDASTTIAQKTYTLSLDLDADKTLSLEGTCTGESTGGGGGGGFPGGDFPGFGEGEMPFGAVAAGNESAPAASSAKAYAAAAEETPDADSSETTDWSQYDFTIGGTWTEEKGWGYVLTFDDEDDTVIHVNFDTISGRHYFYYYIAPTIGGEKADEALVRMEAKDSAYRKTLNAGYKIYEERTCSFMFRGGQEGGSGNLASGYIYLMPDGSVVSLSGTSNSLTYSGKGSWSEDKVNHVINMDVNGTQYATNAYCDTPGREGYRMEYKVSSFGGSSSMTLYASCDPDKYTWDLYTAEDFEGANLYTLEADGVDYKLVLTAKGYLRVEDNSGSVKVSTTYTVDDNNNYTFAETSYGTITATTEGNVVTIVVDLAVKSGSGPFATTIDIEGTYTLTLNG